MADKIKEIEIEGQKFKIKRLTFKERLSIFGDQAKSKEDLNIDLVKACLIEPILTTEQVADLDGSIGMDLLTSIMEFNGMSRNFQRQE